MTMVTESDNASQDLERDMKASEEVKTFVADSEHADQLYASLCNRPWKHQDGTEWACSWRYAGGLVSEIRCSGDYMDHYCSGNEGYVAPEVKAMMEPMGWVPMTDAEAEAYYGKPGA